MKNRIRQMNNAAKFRNLRNFAKSKIPQVAKIRNPEISKQQKQLPIILQRLQNRKTKHYEKAYLKVRKFAKEDMPRTRGSRKSYIELQE